MKLLNHTRENERNEDKKRRRHSPNERENEDNKDVISDFPELVLIHTLSFLKAKEAVQTCILSKKWKDLWKGLSTLTLHSSHFTTLEGFTEFVNGVLSLRDTFKVLDALDFKLWDGFHPHPDLLDRIIGYAVSHNVNCLRLSYDFHHIPSSLFSCSSLTSLDLWVPSYPPLVFPNSLHFPLLTYLKLRLISFYPDPENDCRVEPFSTFNRLNTLILHNCIVSGAQTIHISNTTLLNLSIHSSDHVGTNWKVELSAPNLSTFTFGGTLFQKFYGSSLSSIKQVIIDVDKFENYPMEASLSLLNWLIKTDIKSLTVCPKTLQALSIVRDILKLKLPSLCNLKSLNLNLSCYAYRFSWMGLKDIISELASGKSWKENVKLRDTIKAEAELQQYSSALDEMIDLLLQNSPSAKVGIQLWSY